MRHVGGNRDRRGLNKSILDKSSKNDELTLLRCDRLDGVRERSFVLIILTVEDANCRVGANHKTTFRKECCFLGERWRACNPDALTGELEQSSFDFVLRERSLVDIGDRQFEFDRKPGVGRCEASHLAVGIVQWIEGSRENAPRFFGGRMSDRVATSSPRDDFLNLVHTIAIF